MRRRDFVKVVSGLAITWPLAADAQQPAMRVLGFLHIGTPDAFTNSALTAFRRGLQETGYVEGQNLTIEYRFAENKGDRLPALAADLVNRQVNLIFELAGGTITALAAKTATSTIPIVLAFGANPVKLGLAQSFNRPGGNVTGVTFYTNELVTKRVEVLCELLPQARKIAYLRCAFSMLPAFVPRPQLQPQWIGLPGLELEHRATPCTALISPLGLYLLE